MRPLRSPPDDYEIRARARCGACGRTGDLAGEELHGAASMDALKELERRFRCSDCGEPGITIEPIWHKDWTG
jgi:ribosomal protein S14